MSWALAHPGGEKFPLLFARFLASVCKLLVQPRPILYFVAQKTEQLFFPSIVQRAELWEAVRAWWAGAIIKSVGSFLCRGCFSSYRVIHTNPQLPFDSQWNARLLSVQGGDSAGIKSFLSESSLGPTLVSMPSEWSQARTGKHLLTNLSPALQPKTPFFLSWYLENLNAS